MDSIKATARQAGIVYFLFMIIAIIGEFLFPTFLVLDDAAATAHNISVGEFTYRISILLGFVTHLFFIVLIVLLYKLFVDVDRTHALLMLLFVCIGLAAAFAQLLLKFVPLVLLSGADYLSAFTKPQLDALVLASLRWHGMASAVPTGFWGLWLFPFGVLVIKSGFFPRIFGILLILAGVGYVITSVASIAFPDQKQTIFKIATPLYFGEVPIVFWLLIKGARAPQPAA